jgi:hypothetical protein
MADLPSFYEPNPLCDLRLVPTSEVVPSNQFRFAAVNRGPESSSLEAARATVIT